MACSFQIPFHLRWHNSSSFFVMSSERGQLQCWDRALNPLLIRLRNATGSRDGATVFHLQQYLRHQPSIGSLKWSSQPQQLNNTREALSKPVKPMRHKSMRSSRNKLRSRFPIPQTSSAKAAAHHLFISFERGPVLCLEFLTSCWPANSSLDSLSLCSEFLIWQQFDAAVQHLLSLNWSKVSSFQVISIIQYARSSHYLYFHFQNPHTSWKILNESFYLQKVSKIVSIALTYF